MDARVKPGHDERIDRSLSPVTRGLGGATHGPGTGGKICWCRRADSNRQPIAYEAIALPLSYCGVQRGPCSKLLSNKPPPVEEAQSALPYPSSLRGIERP